MAEEGRGEWLLIAIMNDKQADIRNDNANLRKENKRLQKENERQKKALAEAAILLTLKKKFHHLFAEDRED